MILRDEELLTVGDVWARAVGAQLAADPPAPPAPEKWAPWLRTMFPAFVAAGFVDRHVALWRWLWALQKSAPGAAAALAPAFVALWPRGGGKTTTAELGTAAVGLRNRRRYALIVRSTQERADDSVTSIGAMLEADSVAKHYPKHARRKIGKHGNAKGWRRSRLWTDGGFIVDAIGLDVAARGVKLEDQRPDFIVLDDVDEKHDSPATTAKKIATLTTSILPAGSPDVAVLAVQNVIIPDGFFGRMVHRPGHPATADYLSDRIVSGPFPAVDGLRLEFDEDAVTGARKPRIVAGTATWPGQSLDVCQAQLERWGPVAFLKESQHEVFGRGERVALDVRPGHFETLLEEDAQRLAAQGRPFGGIDFGLWRFGFVLRVADRHGVVHQLAELFSQRESHTARAVALHALLAHYGAEDAPLWGDAANPQDILELNLAFQRIGSRARVVPVGMANKQRAASVERITDALSRYTVRYRERVLEAHAELLAAAFRRPEYRELLGPAFERPAGDFRRWLLNYNASGSGTEMTGSRLAWELGKWEYPVPKEGEAQKQDPDDHTADGADLIAADRYALMSWWTAAETPPAPVRTHEDQHAGFARAGDALRGLHPRQLEAIANNAGVDRPTMPRPPWLG